MKKGVLLDLVLTNREGPVGSVKIGDSISYNDYMIMEFRIL